MRPSKILLVDDEAMALKYFERLVAPLGPVLLARSVEEGRTVLSHHASEIAVLVCDQRMPGERGNELLSYAREHHPHIVRILTTAYSEIGETVAAINEGEIFRYIPKPWDLDVLRTDLRNALELAGMRAERDELLRDKLLAQQSQLAASRLSGLFQVAASLHEMAASQRALHQYVRGLTQAGVSWPQVDWGRWDYADLVQAEALRGVGVGRQLGAWLARFGGRRAGHDALGVLQEAIGGERVGDALVLKDRSLPGAPLLGLPGSVPSDLECACLAWLLWTGGDYGLDVGAEDSRITLLAPWELPPDWLAQAVERLR